MSAPTTDHYLASLTRDTEALAAAAEVDLHAPIAACPAWDMADLAFHVATVHRFWTHMLVQRLQVPEGPGVERPADDDLPGFVRAGLEPLVAAIRETPPDTPIWTWAPRQEAAFVPRRMAHETGVHRWDAEAAVGTPRPIDAAIAVDGIDEVLELVVPAGVQVRESPPIAAHLHCTDTEGEWVVTVDGGKVSVAHAHEKQPVAVRGSASDLNLLLWRRVPWDAVEVFGDEEMARALVALTDLE